MATEAKSDEVKKSSDGDEAPGEDKASLLDRIESKCVIRKRYVVCFLCFLGMVIIHSMRVNIAITVVTILDKAPHEKVGSSQRAQELPDVDWTPTMVGLLHATFYVGFLITQVPGGYLATKLPTNRIFGLCICMSCALNLLLPTAIANMGFIFTCSIRVVQGLLEGAVIPTMYKIVNDWSPRLERSSFASFCITGMYAGAIIGFPLDGLITHYGNWQYMFYIHAIFGFVWFFFWFLFVFERPEFDPSVKEDEKNLIMAGRDQVVELDKVPWKAIFTSLPVWAVIVCHFVRSWMFFFLLTNEPAFLNMFNFSIVENGIFSATPHLLKVLCCILGGIVADIVLVKSPCSLTAVRKMFTCFGFGIEALCCYALSRVQQGYVAIVFLNLGVGCSGLTVAGWQVNHLDLAPQFASVLAGISASFGTVGGILSPIVVGIMTHPQTLWNWQKSFILTGTVLAAGVTFYFFLGSGELQPWATKAEPGDESKKEASKEGDESQQLNAGTAKANYSSVDGAGENSPTDQQESAT